MSERRLVNEQSGPRLEPVVSILCATYNHGRYIRDCLDGFLMQNVSFPVEILVRDDASDDETVQTVREYEEAYPHLFRNIYETENQFSQGRLARDFLMPVSSGEFLAWCEGDDVWTDPLKLQKQVDYLRRNSRESGCYTDYSLIDKNGSPINLSTKPKARPSFSHLDVLRSGCPKALSLMVRRESVQRLIEKLDDFAGLKNGDQLICSFATERGDIAYLPEITGAYRVGSGFWSTMHKGRQHRTQVDSFLQMAEIFNSEEERAAIAQRVTMRMVDVTLLEGEATKEWRMEIQSRMADLHLPFDEPFYQGQLKRKRWRLLNKRIRDVFSGWIR